VRSLDCSGLLWIAPGHLGKEVTSREITFTCPKLWAIIKAQFAAELAFSVALQQKVKEKDFHVRL